MNFELLGHPLALDLFKLQAWCVLCEDFNVNVKWVQGAGNKKVQQGKFATRLRKGGTLVILVLFVLLVMMLLLTVVVMMMIAGTSGGQFVLPDPPVMLI